MTLPLYLAMTAAEISTAAELPPKVAYMACHFSPYTSGLSNLPRTLPDSCILILNDRIPLQGHDPNRIASQLMELTDVHRPTAILLDFQRAECGEAHTIAKAILDTLSCPVGISEQFAKDLSCPVFLSPPPLHLSLETYIAPWHGREIWLEAALDCRRFTVTEKSSICDPCPIPTTPLPFSDSKLHCHYQANVSPERILFYLCRTAEDLHRLLQEAQKLGVTKAIGLHQELGAFFDSISGDSD